MYFSKNIYNKKLLSEIILPKFTSWKTPLVLLYYPRLLLKIIETKATTKVTPLMHIANLFFLLEGCI